MKPKKRQKLCHYCEAEVDLDVIVCPYCAADLREEKPEQQQKSSSVHSVKQLHTEQSLYPPPYPIKGIEEAPAPEPSVPRIAVLPEEEGGKEKQTLLALTLCTLGAQFFVLALMILFFAEGGALILKWSTKWWPLYLIASFPLLFFGVKRLWRGD